MYKFDTILPNIDSPLDELVPALMRRVEELHWRGVVVQAQPVGVMRLALSNQKNNEPGLFLHVWAPDLPIQETGGPFIHTHVFKLKSKVLSGAIKDCQYKLIHDREGLYKTVIAKCTEQYCSIIKVNNKVDVEIDISQEIRAGQAYEVKKNEFHLTEILGDKIAVTLMEKSEIDNADPILVIPRDVNISYKEFKRDQLDQNKCYERIKNFLSKCLS